MTHTYIVTGMSCDGCRTKVEKILNAIEGVEAFVLLDSAIATITMEKHIPTKKLQEALTAAGKYTIEMGHPKEPSDKVKEEAEVKSCCGDDKHAHTEDKMEEMSRAASEYYCPMHCEGDKVYEEAGDCPVCGMHLKKGTETKEKTAKNPVAVQRGNRIKRAFCQQLWVNIIVPCIARETKCMIRRETVLYAEWI